MSQVLTPYCILRSLPFISIGENRPCISIVKYLYLPAFHVIINQHQRNREHANVILIEIFILKSQGYLKQIHCPSKKRKVTL